MPYKVYCRTCGMSLSDLVNEQVATEIRDHHIDQQEKAGKSCWVEIDDKSKEAEISKLWEEIEAKITKLAETAKKRKAFVCGEIADTILEYTKAILKREGK
jgi:ACT domain-containing protein